MRKQWFFENLRAEALKYKTKAEFKRENRRAYAASTKSKDYDLIVEHMPKYLNKSGKEANRVNWTPDLLCTESSKYKKRIDFVRGNRNAYFAALNRGKEFLDKICSHMELPQTKAYTDEELYSIALNYRTRGEFQKEDLGAYSVAHRKGNAFFDSICSHMSKRVDQSGENNPNFRWRNGELQAEANKYLRRSDFENGNPGAAHAARKRGIYEQICKNMKPSGGSSRAERELLNTIKTFLSNARRLRDMKVKISNKPHIKGFEIDVYIPELCKGIEFDGKYWHSFEKMRKDSKKVKWSDEDIRNYHQLKDEYFLSKGIQVLHIKEEDWNKNKEECVKKCLEFLTLNSCNLSHRLSIGPNDNLIE